MLETRGRPKAEVLLSAENRNQNRKPASPAERLLPNLAEHLISVTLTPPCKPCSASLMPGPTGHSTRCRRRQCSQFPQLSLHSQSVHSEGIDSLRLAHFLPPQLKLCSLYPSLGNHRIYQLQHAETESTPNVVRLFSAETECPPKVPICSQSAPKPKPKFGRPLLETAFSVCRQWHTVLDVSH